MTETFTPWDAANYLHTEEDARLYLEACAEDDPGDGSLIRAALQDIARSGNMSREELTKHNPDPAAAAFLDLNDRPSALPRAVDPGLR